MVLNCGISCFTDEFCYATSHAKECLIRGKQWVDDRLWNILVRNKISQWQGRREIEMLTITENNFRSKKNLGKNYYQENTNSNI